MNMPGFTAEVCLNSAYCGFEQGSRWFPGAPVDRIAMAEVVAQLQVRPLLWCRGSYCLACMCSYSGSRQVGCQCHRFP